MSRILVTGSRDWSDWKTMAEALSAWDLVLPDAVLVHGDARGADKMAAQIWQSWGQPVEAHAADWSLGRRAGPLRNQYMVSLGADVCLAFIKNNSRGASHCAGLAEEAGIETRRFTA